MKKDEFLKKEGLKIRRVTSKDRACAKTDYQRNADYIIRTKSGKEYFSKNGSIADCKTIIKLNTPKTTRASVKKCVNTQKNTATKSIYARKSPIKRAPSPNTVAIKKTKTTKGVKTVKTNRITKKSK